MARLSPEDIDDEFTEWIVVSAGEGIQPATSMEEAIASAKEQAEEVPNLVLAIYQLAHFVSARVQPAALFEPKAASKKRTP